MILISLSPTIKRGKKVEIYFFHPFAICYFERFFSFLERHENNLLDLISVTIRGQLFCEFSALIEAWGIMTGSKVLNSRIAASGGPQNPNDNNRAV